MNSLMTNNSFPKTLQKGFTLIEVLLAMQILTIVLMLFAMFYIYLIGEWKTSVEKEERLSYERHFLHYLSRDIQNAVSVTKDTHYLYLLMDNGVSYRYHYKHLEKRVDVGTKQSNGFSYLGRITAGVHIDYLDFEITDYGVLVTYKVLGSEIRERFYRYRQDG
ncbi:hypothetical protein BHF68_01645 [Desulfuribacillus alkaliarsenatis]|uniref:Prepilin-type N-terminal cleavage/methylation domain-containing protein n=2 Tax=Desulfuribacillus alkaliarsenatis TaxID=766136 RepID=A0A1E5G5G2_9FIRM|nr:hypothetical protein BHF68_01645 [Desulfuribacillus alkaliarsenatis]